MTDVPRGPVFVAGLERSGTSLMFALLASHPNIAMTRRTNLWTHFYEQYGDLAVDANFERCLATMMRYRRIVKLGLDPDRLRRDFLAGPRTYPRLFALVEAQYAQAIGKPRWGDKSLHTERWAPQIFDAYPGARILHMIRDPRDRYASSKTRWGIRRGGVGAGTGEWLASARLAMEHARRFPDRYRVVRYETLVTRPEETVRELCAFVGEPFAPGMLAMEGGGRFTEEGGNSSYRNHGAGVISSDSIGRFRSVLTARQVACMQLLAADEMALLGYEREPVRLTGPARVRYAVGDLPLELARLVAWRAREGLRNHRGRPVPSYRLVPSAPSERAA